jgi:LicD family
MTSPLVRRAGLTLRPGQRERCTARTLRCDFWNWGPDALRPQCCTDHMMELTVFVHELLDQHGIVHWVDFGTLLGAVREQALIPWDEDADFGVLEADVPRILALEPEIAAKGHVVDTSDPAVVRITYSAVNDLPLDLLRWEESGDELRGRLGSDEEWPGLHNRTSFPKRYIERLEPVQLYDRPFPAPSPVDRFLVDHRYGPDYLVPTRTAISVWLYPDLEPEEMTPVVKRLLATLTEKDQRLAELSHRAPLSRARPVEAWRNAGRPLGPSHEYLERAQDGVRPPERSGAVEQMIYTIAAFEQAIEELENPRPADPLRRAYRRLVRGGQAVRAKLTGRRRPPFGMR